MRVEVGRFDHGVYIPVDERICQICNEGVEDELHVLFKCPFYNEVQMCLFSKATELNPNFVYFDEVDKFIYLMSDLVIMFYTAKTCKTILDRWKGYFCR